MAVGEMSVGTAWCLEMIHSGLMVIKSITYYVSLSLGRGSRRYPQPKTPCSDRRYHRAPQNCTDNILGYFIIFIHIQIASINSLTSSTNRCTFEFRLKISISWHHFDPHIANVRYLAWIYDPDWISRNISRFLMGRLFLGVRVRSPAMMSFEDDQQCFEFNQIWLQESEA